MCVCVCVCEGGGGGCDSVVCGGEHYLPRIPRAKNQSAVQMGYKLAALEADVVLTVCQKWRCLHHSSSSPCLSTQSMSDNDTASLCDIVCDIACDIGCLLGQSIFVTMAGDIPIK